MFFRRKQVANENPESINSTRKNSQIGNKVDLALQQLLEESERETAKEANSYKTTPILNKILTITKQQNADQPPALTREKLTSAQPTILNQAKQPPPKITVVNRLAMYKFKKLQEKNSQDAKPMQQIVAGKLRKAIATKRKLGNRSHTNILRQKEEEMAASSCLINPNGSFKKSWETFKFVLLLYIFLYLPLKVTFFVDDPNDYGITYFIEKGIDVVFFFDMLLTFITPTIDKYDMAYDHKTIARLYLKGWFTLDLLTIIPFEELGMIFLDEKHWDSAKFLAKVLKFFRLFRLVKLARLFKSFDFKNSDNYIIKWAALSMKGTVFFLTVPNFMLTIFAVHLFSCIWYYIGASNDNNTGWLAINNFQGQSIMDQYIASMHLVMQTFTTTGYGDIYSKSMNEISFRMLIILSGVLIYSLFSGQVIEYKIKALANDEKYEMRKEKLEKMVKKYNIPKTLYYNLLEQFQLQSSTEASLPYDFSNLTDSDMNEFEYWKFISKFHGVKLFSDDIGHRNFVLQLGRKLKKREYFKDQIIYLKREPAVSFYIIKKGAVEIESTICETIPAVKIKGGFFGEYELMKNIDREFTARAATDTVLYILDSFEFKKLFLNSQEDLFSEEFIATAISRHETLRSVDKQLTHFFIRKVFWRTVLKSSKKAANRDKLNKLIMRDFFRAKSRK
jgi:hypothetical protein